MARDERLEVTDDIPFQFTDVEGMVVALEGQPDLVGARHHHRHQFFVVDGQIAALLSVIGQRHRTSFGL